MSRATAARPVSAPATKAVAKAVRGYFHRSELPLTSLVFLLPFLLIYEVGTRYMSNDIIAFTWMQDFFRLFGAPGRHFPALAVVSILISWHIARRDSWQVSPKHLLGMLVESVVLAIPLILIGMVAARYVPLAGNTVPQASVPANVIVLSIGAGIYEELVFRLIAFSLLGILFVDVLEIPRSWANVLMVVISALCFSLYHYLGHESFQVRTFAFRTAAGFYFGAVFAFRGFGISAGSHAAYDIVVSFLRTLPTP